MNYSVYQVFFVLLPIVIGYQAQRSVGPKDFQRKILTEHNKFRKMHGVPPLKWNQDIAKYAQEWAEENARTNRLHHHTSTKYGENLFSTTGSLSDPKKPVGSWYSEIKDYNYNDPKLNGKSGHFTQVVWKASKELGCGIAKNKTTYISCNYFPPGNVVGGLKSNVPPLIKTK